MKSLAPAIILAASVFVAGSCGGPTRSVIPKAGVSSMLVDLEPSRAKKETRSEWRLHGAIESYFDTTFATRVHLQLEKSVVRPGESIWLDTWVAESGSLNPTNDSVSVSLFDRHGELILHSDASDHGPQGRLRVPITAQPGRYTLVASLSSGPTSTRNIVVQGFGSNRNPHQDSARETEVAPIDYTELEVAFFPEGGEHVIGLPTRMHFLATTPDGRGVKVEGSVLDANQKLIARLGTNELGMGRLEYVPGRSPLRLVLDQQKHKRHRLPVATPKGCVLLSADVDDSRSDLRMGVWCPRSQRVVVAAIHNDRLVDVIATQVQAHEATLVSFTLPNARPGAVHVTLFDDEPAPLAQRLVFRGRGKALQIKMTSDREKYASGDEVQVDIETRDAQGEPVNAIVSVAVATRDSAEQARGSHGQIAPAILVESELAGNRVEAPEHYFSKAPSAPQDLDLLLAIHGGFPFDWEPVFAHVVEWRESEEAGEAKEAEIRDRNFRDDELESELIKPFSEGIDPRKFAGYGRTTTYSRRDTPQSPSPMKRWLGPIDIPNAGDKPEQGFGKWEFVADTSAGDEKPGDPSLEGHGISSFRRSVQTDKKGHGTLTFRAADAGTEFRISVEAISHGLFGKATHAFRTQPAPAQQPAATEATPQPEAVADTEREDKGE